MVVWPGLNGRHNPGVGFMAVLLNHTAVRALLLAVILAFVAAMTAPVARGASAPGEPQVNSHRPAFSTQHLILADEWSWREFVRFWGRQFGSMTGVLGTVLLVGAGAVLLILYKGKG
jgi:hypothetical protein